ncbi:MULTISPECIES: DUF5610 domain-containing protein [Shewanella]|jgi:archaellum component FlaC|uniref:DUF5610 domain-containing protein n=1 Tax=Shewanella TaxID=22 RepID=UPI00200DFCCE|nr:DUF5610 domain-containing protein [Shewanella basaltis]MCL1114836.1 DUF5610 domain-containing protein [Shewanella basaltis]
MDIKSTNSTNISAQRDTTTLNDTSKSAHQATKSAVAEPKMTNSQLSRQMMNNSILAAQEEVSIAAGDQSMALLYRAAIEAINEELAPTLGEKVVQKNADEGIDYSPEATADRIVSFATNFFSTHQQQNQSMDFDEQVSSFMLKIGDAIDQGFKEASDILSGLKVLEGDIAAGVDQTYELIQQKLAQFAQDKLDTNTAKTKASEG